MNNTTISDFGHASFQGTIGIARADITPPVGIYARNWGAAKHDLATSIHRHLTLTVMTLGLPNKEVRPLATGHDSDTEHSREGVRPLYWAKPANSTMPLILIDVDLGWWKSPLTARTFLQRLREALSLNSEQLIFALSHTHSGPPLMEADDSFPGSDIWKSWFEGLFVSAIETVREALKAQFEGILDWHTGRCGLATNRDLPDPDRNCVDGMEGTAPLRSRLGHRDGGVPEKAVCGYNPNGVSDDTLVVGRVTDSTGRIRATLVNYACHPTTLAWENSAISPDFVGAMRETIQNETGAPALFLIGACGELAPRYQYVDDVEVADRHGRELGFAALATFNGMEPAGTRLAYLQTIQSGAPLAVWKHQHCDVSRALFAIETTVELPVKDWPSADELEQQRLACNDRTQEERLRRKRDIRRCLGDGSVFDLPIHAWRIGDAVLVGSCCEAYSFLQLELRRRFPNHTIICVNLINGSIGYLPPSELYDSDVYPVWQTPFDCGCLEKTLESMTQVVHDVLSK